MPEMYDPNAAIEPEALDEGAEQRLGALAEAMGSDPRRLQVLAERALRLEHSGIEARFYKLFDTGTGGSARLVIDASGRASDAGDLLAEESAARRQRYGVMQPALHELLDRMDDDRRVPVLLRYAVDEDPVAVDKRELEGRELTDEEMARMGRIAARHEAEVSERTRALHREAMRADDVEVDDERAVSGPFVRAELSAETVRRLRHDQRLAFLGLDGEKEIPDYPTIAESLPTTRTDTVQASGVRGAGVRIAVLESGCPNVSTACFNIGATQDLAQPANDHMTKSVGIIGNRYSQGGCGGSWEGYAPDATVLLANASDYQDRYDWARGQSVNVVTMSWHFGSEETSGGLHSRDVYFDYWVTRWPFPSVFTSAGNQADGDAYASGKGYNFFGVGNVLNEDDGDRCDDVISSSSSWKNPSSPHDDHEVPAIAAPGSRHELLGSSFGGTSCATPVAASIAALLMSKNTSLKIWPEAIRAILLATANYQGADGADYSRSSDGKDGAGMVNALYGMWTAGRRESNGKPQFRAHDYGHVQASDFASGYFARSWTACTWTTSSRIRVALAWDSKTTASGGTPVSSVLDADLDLHVFDPDGQLVAWGASWDNSWEFVEFTPSKVGNYTIRVLGYSVPADFSSWYGVAWTTHYDLC